MGIVPPSDHTGEPLSSIRDEYTREIAVLQELGFEIVAEDYQPELFGNSLVDLRNEQVVLRIVRDRGQEWILVAPADTPQDWYDLDMVMQFLSLDHGTEDWLDRVSGNLAAIAGALNGPAKRNLQRLLRDRAPGEPRQSRSPSGSFLAASAKQPPSRKSKAEGAIVPTVGRASMLSQSLPLVLTQSKSGCRPQLPAEGSPGEPGGCQVESFLSLVG